MKQQLEQHIGKIMHFSKSEPPITLTELSDVERQIDLTFPASVKELYLRNNGGIPDPYVYEDSNLDTVVSKFLPLKSENVGTVTEAYEQLVLRKKLVPSNFLPFAVDGGGDYFFVDCTTSDGVVHFFRSDSADSHHLLNLRLGFKKFWALLKSE